jgi:release factor glutamine methyltransferase
MNLSDILLQYKQELQPLYPIEEAESICRWAAEHVCQQKWFNLLRNKEDELIESQSQQLISILAILKTGQPIQYVLGETEFYGLSFKVNKHVLIPRPETEELVDWILKDIKKLGNPVWNLLDIGTGSGCIPISIKKNSPQLAVTSVDVSSTALNIAQENAAWNQTSIIFIENNILSPDKMLTEQGPWQVIVSNPPYVLELEKERMHQNVLEYEPHLALFVENENPLLFYKAIATFSREQLASGGWLYFEINETKGAETCKMLTDTGFSNIELRKDLRGKDRMVKATKI